MFHEEISWATLCLKTCVQYSNNLGICCVMDWMFVPHPPRFICQNPNHQLCIRRFGLWGSLNYKDGALRNRIIIFINETPKRSLILLPCEGTAMRRPSINQEVGLHQTPNLLPPWSWTSHSPQRWEINFCCL